MYKRNWKKKNPVIDTNMNQKLRKAGKDVCKNVNKNET